MSITGGTNPAGERLIKRYTEHCRRIAMATTIDLNEVAADKIKRRTELEKEYTTWFEYYFPNYAKAKCAPFHQKLARDVINNTNIRLLAEMYRSAGKSVHIDLGIPLYLYLAKKELRFMLLMGETERKAKKLLSDISAQISHNNRLINDYGNRTGTGSWADGDFLTGDGIRFMSLGFGQDPRGAKEGAERPDYIVVDDCDTKKHVNNDRLMREAVDFITEDLWGCFDAATGSRERFVFANNNFHKNGITNRMKLYFEDVIKTKSETGDAVFKVITVKAVNNITDFEPAWPDKTDKEYWRTKFNAMPYRSFMREYMHTHIEDGAIFKHEDIRYCKPLPLKKYEALCFYGDLSYKANADYKAMILIGKTGKEFHVIFTYLRQKSRADCARWLYDMYVKHQLFKYNIRYMIEGLFAQDEFVNDFDIEGEKRNMYIPVIADKRPKVDKYDRVESLSGYWERGWWMFCKDTRTCVSNTDDQQILIDQFMAFEKGSKAHDDGPDACHGATAYLNLRTRNNNAKYSFGKRTNHRY
jgi:predicted phage terminase large subunit-like protein